MNGTVAPSFSNWAVAATWWTLRLSSVARSRTCSALGKSILGNRRVEWPTGGVQPGNRRNGGDVTGAGVDAVRRGGFAARPMAKKLNWGIITTGWIARK